jgi:hypothetical protein
LKTFGIRAGRAACISRRNSVGSRHARLRANCATGPRERPARQVRRSLRRDTLISNRRGGAWQVSCIWHGMGEVPNVLLVARGHPTHPPNAHPPIHFSWIFIPSNPRLRCLTSGWGSVCVERQLSWGRRPGVGRSDIIAGHSYPTGETRRAHITKENEPWHHAHLPQCPAGDRPPAAGPAATQAQARVQSRFYG